MVLHRSLLGEAWPSLMLLYEPLMADIDSRNMS